ncbi:unnamed protein product [Trichogramma brassicae]|uniref:Uncharacterized protein n=1 Tax=Trichogramma brassicae TaxID=86971 RepID=A0A6H5ITL9_9HYME|nr:unnamed protein product [Trichogramma brassicae]
MRWRVHVRFARSSKNRKKKRTPLIGIHENLQLRCEFQTRCYEGSISFTWSDRPFQTACLYTRAERPVTRSTRPEKKTHCVFVCTPCTRECERQRKRHESGRRAAAAAHKVAFSRRKETAKKGKKVKKEERSPAAAAAAAASELLSLSPPRYLSCATAEAFLLLLLSLLLLLLYIRSCALVEYSTPLLAARRRQFRDRDLSSADTAATRQVLKRSMTINTRQPIAHVHSTHVIHTRARVLASSRAAPRGCYRCRCARRARVTDRCSPKRLYV